VTLWPQKNRPERPKGAQVPVEYGVADVHSAVRCLSPRPGGRESGPPQTAGPVSGTRARATPDNGLVSPRDGRAREVLRVARRAGARATGNLCQMASGCAQDVLAREVAQAKPSGVTEKQREPVFQMAREDPTRGEERIADELSTEAGHSSLSANHPQASHA